MDNRTVVFSPIRQDPAILELFLEGLESLEINNPHEFWFLDDNEDQDSKELLVKFSKSTKNTKIIRSPDAPIIPYIKDDNHHWNNDLANKIIKLKNLAISLFLNSDNNEMFFVDSDLILHPKTLLNLQSLNVPIVSEVFWTKFSNKVIYLPNVWDINSYSFHSAESILRLKQPGLYEVGGLGACTLIQRKPLEAGVNFSRVSNLDFWGEDRHFCARAICLGYSLYADTHYPPFHVYQKNLVDDATSWIEGGYQTVYFERWLDTVWEEQVKKMFIPKKRKLVARILRRFALFFE